LNYRFARFKSLFLVLILLFILSGISLHGGLLAEQDSHSVAIKIQALIARSNQFFKTNPDSARCLAHQAIKIARRQGDTDLLGKSLYQLGYLYYRWVEIDSARKYLEEITTHRKQIDSSSLLGRTMNLLGNTCWLTDDQVQAKSYFEKALAIHTELKDHKEIGKSHNNLANFYSRLGDYDRAIDHFLKVRQSYHQADYLEGEAWLDYSMTLLYKRLEDYDKAREAILSSLQKYERLAAERQDSTGVMLCYTQLGDVHRLLGDYKQGLQYNRDALRLRKKTGAGAAVADGMTGVGQCYYQLGQYAQARQYMQQALEFRKQSGIRAGSETNYKYLGYIHYEEGNVEQALADLEQGLRIARERNQQISQSEILWKMSEIHAAEGNYAQAWELRDEYIAIKDSLWDIKTSKRIAAIQLQYKIDQQARENEKLAQINRINELKLERASAWRNFLILLIVFFICVIVMTIYLYRKKLQIKTLKGLLPICAHCKKIRNDKGYYEHVENFISEHSEAIFSHGLCPDCMAELYPEYVERKQKKSPGAGPKTNTK